MTSRKPFLAEISNINIFHITLFFVKVTNVISGTYRTFWHIFRIYSTAISSFFSFFKAGLVPLSSTFSSGGQPLPPDESVFGVSCEIPRGVHERILGGGGFWTTVPKKV